MSKLKPKFKIADKFLDTMEDSPIIMQLEEQIKLREMPIEEQAKYLLKKKSFMH